VRAPTGDVGNTEEKKTRVLATYARQGLKHIRWTDDPENGRTTTASVTEHLQTNTADLITNSSRSSWILLFHDLNSETAEHLGEYIDTIENAAKAQGKRIIYPKSKDDVNEILSKW